MRLSPRDSFPKLVGPKFGSLNGNSVEKSQKVKVRVEAAAAREKTLMQRIV